MSKQLLPQPRNGYLRGCTIMANFLRSASQMVVTVSVSPAFGSSSENAQWNFVKTQRTARTENANLSSDALPAQGVN